MKNRNEPNLDDLFDVDTDEGFKTVAIGLAAAAVVLLGLLVWAW